MFGNFFSGALSVISVTATPQLYRYPYRTSAEALRGDMKRIGKDIDTCLDQITREEKKEEYDGE